eukprot:2561629-Pleurochrysis_carterae.AAC.2
MPTYVHCVRCVKIERRVAKNAAVSIAASWQGSECVRCISRACETHTKRVFRAAKYCGRRIQETHYCAMIML